MNKIIKITVTAISFLAGLACIGELAVIAGQHSAARANYSVGVTPADTAIPIAEPTSQYESVINLEPVTIVGTAKASHKVNQATAIAKPVVYRLHVLEQGGRPGGEFVLASE